MDLVGRIYVFLHTYTYIHGYITIIKEKEGTNLRVGGQGRVGERYLRETRGKIGREENDVILFQLKTSFPPITDTL